MNTILIYALNEKLCIHSINIIPLGEIQIINQSGQMIKSFCVENCNFESFKLDIPPDRYKIRLKTAETVIEKQLYLGNRKSLQTLIFESNE
jgi:hypothetical protein